MAASAAGYKPNLAGGNSYIRPHIPALDEAVALAEEFTGLIRDRALDRLDPWLRKARGSTVRQLQNFAKGLQDDHAAVQAAVTLDWSNGQVEGRINRLKTLKRQMYGRADLDLLGQRFLLRAIQFCRSRLDVSAGGVT